MTVENRRADPFEEIRTWHHKLDRKGWWHSFALPDGTCIEGVNSLMGQKFRLGQFPIPEDLSGKRVLDIGCWDGWFSFEMERRGAEVMAIDDWDNPRFHEMHRLLNSRVDYRQLDMFDLTPARVGRFDIVIFMGVLYHLKHPLLALERVCALTTGMAAVESFILREQHMAGHAIEALPVMAFYENDELAGQIDNWVAPTVACLLAFCRTAGFARAELQNVTEFGAAVACHRHWEPPAHVGIAGPRLVDVSHNRTGAINFESEREAYLTAFVDSPAGELTSHDVKPEIGGYGVTPVQVWHYAKQRWQVDFRLPPGLAPGWHDVRVRIGDSRPSNVLRIAVDLPLEVGPIRIVGVRDGVTWAANQIDINSGGALSLWIDGLPENADRNNVRVYLADVRLDVTFLEPAGSGGPRQMNARLPGDVRPGSSQLVVAVGNRRSDSVEIEVAGMGWLASYDAIADEYAKHFHGELADKPFDRQLLDQFAERTRGRGPVCDLGCGPGQVARYLRGRGVTAFGIDVSAGMLGEARRLNPGLEFVRGDMNSMPIRMQSLAGVAAFYSIIHMDPELLRSALAEMRRALRRGGYLLLTFHLGEELIHATDFHGRAVDLRATLFTLVEMSGYLKAAGFAIDQALERDPYPEIEYQSRRGYILAVNPHE